MTDCISIAVDPCQINNQGVQYPTNYSKVSIVEGCPGSGKTFGSDDSIISLLGCNGQYSVIDEGTPVFVLSFNRNVIAEITNRLFEEKSDKLVRKANDTVEKRKKYLETYHKICVSTIHASGKKTNEDLFDISSKPSSKEDFDEMYANAHLSEKFKDAVIIVDEFQDVLDFVYGLLVNRENDFKHVYLYGDMNQRLEFYDKKYIVFFNDLKNKVVDKKYLDVSLRCSSSWVDLFVRLTHGQCQISDYNTFVCKDKVSKLTIKDYTNEFPVDRYVTSYQKDQYLMKLALKDEGEYRKDVFGYGQVRGLTFDSDKTLLHNLKKFDISIDMKVREIASQLTIDNNVDFDPAFIEEQIKILRNNLAFIIATRFSGNALVYLDNSNKGFELTFFKSRNWFNNRYKYQTTKKVNGEVKTLNHKYPESVFITFYDDINLACNGDKKAEAKLDEVFEKLQNLSTESSDFLTFIKYCNDVNFEVEGIDEREGSKIKGDITKIGLKDLNAVSRFIHGRFDKDLDGHFLIEFLPIYTTNAIFDFIVNYIQPSINGNITKIKRLQPAVKKLFAHLTDYKEKYAKFFVEPKISLGKHWNNKEILKENLIKAIENNEIFVSSNTKGQNVGKAVGKTSGKNLVYVFDNSNTQFNLSLNELGYATNKDGWIDLTPENVINVLKQCREIDDGMLQVFRVKTGSYDREVNFALFDFDVKNNLNNAYENVSKKLDEILKITNAEKGICASSKSGGSHLWLFFKDGQKFKCPVTDEEIKKHFINDDETIIKQQYNICYNMLFERLQSIGLEPDDRFVKYNFKHNNNVQFVAKMNKDVKEEVSNRQATRLMNSFNDRCTEIAENEKILNENLKALNNKSSNNNIVTLKMIEGWFNKNPQALIKGNRHTLLGKLFKTLEEDKQHGWSINQDAKDFIFYQLNCLANDERYKQVEKFKKLIAYW